MLLYMQSSAEARLRLREGTQTGTTIGSPEEWSLTAHEAGGVPYHMPFHNPNYPIIIGTD